MRPSDSFNYQKPSYNRQSHQNTAAKSPQRKRVDQTHQFTPTRFSKKPSDRVNQLKNSINRCIEEFSNKKNQNRSALQQVKDVNRQIVDTLSSPYHASGKQYRSSQRQQDHQDRPQYRTQNTRYDPNYQKERQTITLSSFHLAPTEQNLLRPSNFQTSQVYRPQSQASNQYQIQDMRNRIRDERAQNEGLQRQLAQLQNERRALFAATTGLQNQQDPYLVAQNLRLRQELQRLNSLQNINEIYEQFQRLKEDNERLRRETINLLKNGRY